jgi:hypothetical protein
MMSEEVKRCGSCKEVKGLTEFNRDINKKDGRNTICRECISVKKKIYYQELKNGTRTIRKRIKPRDGYKICGRCDDEKLLKEFYKNRSMKDGLDNKCKSCSSEACREYREKNKKKNHKININDKYKCCQCRQDKLSREFHIDITTRHGLSYTCKQCQNEYRNREEVKKYRKEYKKEYRSRPETKKLEREYDRKRLKDPFHRLNESISAGMRGCLKGSSKAGRHWEKLVNYTEKELRLHLEKQFTDGMTWENYGSWHVDHRIPKIFFNFTKPEHLDFKRCWDLDNLQPMWASDNMSKGTKLAEHFQVGFAYEEKK